MANPADVERAKQGKDGWNAWAQGEIRAGHSPDVDFTDVKFDIGTFEGFTFPGAAIFNQATFEGEVSFREAVFRGVARFSGVTYKYYAAFVGATFMDGAQFDHATFMDHAQFDSTTFNDHVQFAGATFKGDAQFNGSTFNIDTYFSKAIFEKEFYANGATFKQRAEFDDALFKGSASFGGTMFKGRAVFSKASFEGNAWFNEATFEDNAAFDGVTFRQNAVFNRVTFNGTVRFDGSNTSRPPNLCTTSFGIPPSFHQSDIGYEASKENGLLRRLFDCASSPADVACYRRLKQLAGEAKDHDNELKFFALELRAKRFHETNGFWPLAVNVAYGWLSDYGRSIARPTTWLLVTTTVAIVAIGTAYWKSATSITIHSKLADVLAVAFTNSALLIGADKWALRPVAFERLCSTCGSSFGPFGDLLAYAQSGFSLMLLFLIGLGLRNRFRVGGG